MGRRDHDRVRAQRGPLVRAQAVGVDATADDPQTVLCNGGEELRVARAFDRAKAFYVDKLGLKVVREDGTIPGIRWVQVAPDGGTAALTLVTWFEQMPPGCVQGLVLSSNDLDADYKTFTANGVHFDSPPEQQPWATEAVMRDPDGNMLVLQQS